MHDFYTIKGKPVSFTAPLTVYDIQKNIEKNIHDLIKPRKQVWEETKTNTSQIADVILVGGFTNRNG